MFMMLGMVVALIHRYKANGAAGSPPPVRNRRPRLGRDAFDAALGLGQTVDNSVCNHRS